ncbi:amidase [Hypericibacter terrae]|uniref:Amidase n=1 Tax=Hypericibacter terrae TaxID=2602015 RepID=A0A5J6MPS0_9PROT|nr:amidase [Hypericibacter terrae]QEX18645.1 amidase [Hypericibacter terrae]
MTDSSHDAFPDYDNFDALGLGELVRRHEVTPRELVDTAIARIERLDGKLNAVTIRNFEAARAEAERPLSGAPFDGVPFLAKDLSTSWKGMPSTNSCRYFADYVSPSDSEVVRRTRAAGFINLGKTNVPEFGWCLSTEPPLRGVTHNPWDETRVAGGSSGGSAAAVAAGILPLADASDGAGSIRVPAAVNGLVGLKPSRGRMTFAPDYVDFWYGGALFFCVSRTVRDSAAMLDAVKGSLPGEPYQTPSPERSYLDEVTAGGRGLRIGFSTFNARGDRNAAEVVASVENTARLCETLGHHVQEFKFDYNFGTAWRAYTAIISVQTAMGFQGFATMIGRKVTQDDLTNVIWTSIEKGRSISGVQHSLDIETVRIASREIAMLTSPYDVVILPSLPQGTRPLGFYDMSLDVTTYNDTCMGEDNVYMAPFNISGQPAMTLPLAETAAGLPIGVQLVGRPADESTLFRLAGQLEIARPWAHRRPPIHASRI